MGIFERKNGYFGTACIKYRPSVMSQTEPITKTEKNQDESYKSEYLVSRKRFLSD